MEDWLSRVGAELVARTTGLFAFRFVLQPLMGAIFAVRDGVRDAREGHRPYLFAILTHPEASSHLLEEGFSKVKRIVILGVVMELIYQGIVLRAFRPVQLALVVLGLAIMPYLLLRGPVTRIARLWIGPKLEGKTP